MATTALIVDDHRLFRTSARMLLEAEGFDVVGEAADGASAVAAADELRPEFVLLDIQLPDATGFEVAREMLAKGLVGRIVLVSSRSASDYGDQILDSGAVGFVPKSELSGPALAALRVAPGRQSATGEPAGHPDAAPAEMSSIAKSGSTYCDSSQSSAICSRTGSPTFRSSPTRSGGSATADR